MDHEETSHGAQVKSGTAGGTNEFLAKCMSCGVESKVRPLLSCLLKGEHKWVCVRCLPMLIHGTE